MSQLAPIFRSSSQSQCSLPRGSSRRREQGLYAISEGPRGDLLEVVRAALESGAALLQYRDKTRDADRRLHEAHALAELCREFGAPLIINDDVELARASKAAGVHLGEDDVGVADARAVLGPDAIIGVSCYDSLQRAREAANAGAGYLAFGAFFTSPTKPDARRATPDLLRDARAFGLPLVAIGGITPENGGPLVAAGADYLAAISGVFGAADVRAAAQNYAKLFDTDQGG